MQKWPLPGQKQSHNLPRLIWAAKTLFSSPHVNVFPNHAKMAVAWPKKFKTHNLPRLIWAAVRAAQKRRPNHAKMAVAWPKKVKTFNLGCKSFAPQTFFIPSHFPRYTSFTASQFAWPKKVKTHNLPRLIWAAKSSRGANFFHPQPFPMLHVFYGVPTTQKWPLLGQKSQNTQFATFNLGCKKFARRKLFSSISQPNFFSPALSHVIRLLRRPNHAKMAVAWPKKFKTHNLPRLIWAAKSSRGANFFHPSHFTRYTSFTASQPRKNGRCLAKKSQNTQFATFNLGCKNFARRKIFSSPAISHVTRLLRRPNHAKMAVAWPKKVKTHNLPR